MSYSEAVEAVGKLIGAFPNGSPANARGYIGALAAVLADYPRMVATKCADPLKGVARETRFLPTVADVVGWCEREKAGLQVIVDRDDFARAAAREREEIERAEQQLAAARATRPTLQQMEEKHGPRWGMRELEKEDLLVKQARTAKLEQANRAAFEAECRAAKIDPSRVASPSLERLLHGEIRMRKAERLGAEADRLAEQAAE